MTGLWSWTVPLWGLGLLVFCLAAILMGPVDILTRPAGASSVVSTILQPGGVASANQGGGSRARKSSSH